jgi:hypothetical protein
MMTVVCILMLRQCLCFIPRMMFTASTILVPRSRCKLLAVSESLTVSGPRYIGYIGLGIISMQARRFAVICSSELSYSYRFILYMNRFARGKNLAIYIYKHLLIDLQHLLDFFWSNCHHINHPKPLILIFNPFYEIMNGFTDSRLRQRGKNPSEKVEYERLDSMNGSSVSQGIQTSACNKSGAALLAWADIEPWRQYNRFIIRSYRPASNSYIKSICSLGYIHDQSVNIYSHLLGAVAFVAAICFLYYMFSSRYHSATWTDVVVFGAFFLGLFACLMLSAAFHTFNNHSSSVYDYFFMLDMLGITFLIMGSFYPSIYYSFYCEPGPRYFYWAMVRTGRSYVNISTHAL